VISLSARGRERIPAKLKINIQPMVIDKDNCAFQNQWNDTLHGCEKKLLDLLIGDLNNKIAKTISAIRTKFDECLRELKRTQPEKQARSNLQSIPEEAEKLRQK